MTLTPNIALDVPLPEGADPGDVDNWETDNGKTVRLVWSRPVSQPQEFGVDVRVVASQLLDGSIIMDDPLEVPIVYVHGLDFTLPQARVIAAALTEVVDLADRWGRPSDY